MQDKMVYLSGGGCAGNHGMLPYSLFIMPPSGKKRYLYSLDFARGAGAIAILFWHYQHFFYHGADHRRSVPIEQQPLYSVFGLLYRHGDWAVQFFWLISGFVFAATYAGQRVPAAAAFVRVRASRLYPLHFLTLIVVAVLQYGSVAMLGHSQIYGNNDAYHFGLNLFFAASWGFERGSSFNGPVWSVSVEVLVYAVFWLCMGRIFKRGVVFPLGVAASALFLRFIAPPGDLKQISTCLAYFFIGTAVYVAYRAVEAKPIVLLVAAVPLGVLGIVASQMSGPVGTAGSVLFLSGILVAVCAVEASTQGRHLERLRWIGDNSYGTYLWHVPIQIATLVLLDRFRIDHDIARSPLFLAGFIALVMIVARISYLWFERPLRNWLRTSS